MKEIIEVGVGSKWVPAGPEVSVDILFAVLLPPALNCSRFLHVNHSSRHETCIAHHPTRTYSPCLTFFSRQDFLEISWEDALLPGKGGDETVEKEEEVEELKGHTSLLVRTHHCECLLD